MGHSHFTEEQFEQRTQELLEQEKQEPELWWYLSFAGPDGFHGGVYVKARGMVSAILMCHHLGINPHGEVMGIPIPEHWPQPKREYCYRILNKEEIEAGVDEPPVN